MTDVRAGGLQCGAGRLLQRQAQHNVHRRQHLCGQGPGRRLLQSPPRGLQVFTANSPFLAKLSRSLLITGATIQLFIYACKAPIRSRPGHVCGPVHTVRTLALCGSRCAIITAACTRCSWLGYAWTKADNQACADGECRDYGGREDRQKARLMWLVEDWGADKFREMVGARMGGVTLRTAVEEKVTQLLMPHREKFHLIAGSRCPVHWPAW